MSSLLLPLISRRLPSIRAHAAASRHRPSILKRNLSPRLAGSFFASTAANMKPEELKHYLADQPPTVVRLEIEKHFALLTEQQKRYAHFISKAAFAGSRIVLRQLSPESEPIYDLIITLHKSVNGDWDGLAKKAGVEGSELALFLEYAAMFLGNMGNYKSFGDAKFIPRCSEKTVAALAATSPEAQSFYEAAGGAVFSHDDPASMHLGFLDAGHMTTYYPDSNGITKSEIEAVSAWMEEKRLLPENTRLRKTADGFDILIASAVTSIPAEGGDVGKETVFTVDSGPLEGKTISLVYGDHADEMRNITANIKQAAAHADNDNQKNMHLAYAKSFETGSLEAFKDSQRFWIKDKGPDVECNIGFIETYRDPAGVRGEWEGFASSRYARSSAGV
ncbi:hypothetical protein Trco_002045 [Trichoderma cornu-damae]|uniref:Uncharacterized protein n=1 Tax=Trichoderma cornu-damae TaxID=654480 RepID=A0A9P8QP39_9HYPO|nr:hypothetical protein Trco_002045 [Trichoderma cornu-damae]